MTGQRLLLINRRVIAGLLRHTLFGNSGRPLPDPKYRSADRVRTTRRASNTRRQDPIKIQFPRRQRSMDIGRQLRRRHKSNLHNNASRGTRRSNSGTRFMLRSMTRSTLSNSKINFTRNKLTVLRALIITRHTSPSLMSTTLMSATLMSTINVIAIAIAISSNSTMSSSTTYSTTTDSSILT